MSDPFADLPKGGGSFSSRLQGFVDTIGQHASSGHVDHIKSRTQQVGGQAAQQATQLGGQAADRAVGFAADNPDTMERAGEKLGERIGRAAIPVPFVGKKIGGAVGRRVGRSLSESAQARTGGAPQGSQPFDGSDPFGGVDLSRSTHSEPSMPYPDLDPFAGSPSSPQGGSSGAGYSASSDPFAGSQPAQQEEAPKKKMFGRKKKEADTDQAFAPYDRERARIDPFYTGG